MTDKLFYRIFTDAQSSNDREAFISNWEHSPELGDAEGSELPAERLTELGKIWDVAHASFADIVAASGLKLVDFAARYAIPYSTAQKWYYNLSRCPDYTRLLLARAEEMY